MAKFLDLTGLTQVVTNIKDWANGLFVTKSRTVNGKPLSDNITLDASDVGAIPASQKGAVNGVASLDSSGKVPSTQLPSYVDDILDVANYEALPETGEDGKIYVTEDDNKQYRWSGSAYVEISKSIALGETASTAFAGDKGKVAYDHSQAAHAPANAEANVQSDWNEDDTGSDAYIKNKPTALPADGGNADTVNGHTVEANVPADAKFTDTTYNTGTDAVAGITKLYGETGASTDGAMTQAAVTTALGSYALKTEVPTAVSDLTNDSGFQTATDVEGILSEKGYLTSVPDEYVTDTELTEKGYQTSSQVQAAITAATADFVTDADIPTKVSDLTNDAGYLTEVPSEYVTDTELTGKGYQTSAQVESAITSKGYQTASQVNSIVDGKGFLTAVPEEYVTDEELTGKGYQTSGQVQTAISEATADFITDADLPTAITTEEIEALFA